MADGGVSNGTYPRSIARRKLPTLWFPSGRRSRIESLRGAMMSAALMTQRSPSERRAYPRFAAPVLVRYGTNNPSSSGYAFDISEGGLGFSGDAPEPVGCEIRIRFKWDSPLGEGFEARAIVRPSDGNRTG